MLVGDSSGIKQNNFLATEAELRRLHPQVQRPPGRRLGQQRRPVPERPGPGPRGLGLPGRHRAGLLGCLYDESRRNRILATANPKALAAVHKGDWNHMSIRAMGDHITITLNGVTSVDYRETDATIARDGRIAVQIHAGGPMKVEFKDLYIQALPIAKAEKDADAPGFHLRTVKTAAGERKYAVYVPTGYDGSKPVPAVLFLHGSGERGDDGIQGGQIGLGAAILAHPDRFGAIAVLPQASRTWAADSDDAKAALAALDDVVATYKVDPEPDRPDRPLDGRGRDLVDRRGQPGQVLGHRPDLRPGKARGRRDLQGPADLGRRRRRRPDRDRPERPGDGPRPPRGRRQRPLAPSTAPSATTAGTGPTTTPP